MLDKTLLPWDAGLSNTITALTGAGLTGSYIFSQTIFSMRAGVHTRLHGAIIAGKFAPPWDQHLPDFAPPRANASNSCNGYAWTPVCSVQASTSF